MSKLYGYSDQNKRKNEKFGYISIPYHDIFHQLLARNSCEYFLPVLFPLEKIRQNLCDDLLLDRMLAILSGDEFELVALPVIFDTFACRLCFPCWVGWIVSCIVRFLVGCWAYLHVDRGRHVVTNQPIFFSFGWSNHCHIAPDLFVPHL